MFKHRKRSNGESCQASCRLRRPPPQRAGRAPARRCGVPGCRACTHPPAAHVLHVMTLVCAGQRRCRHLRGFAERGCPGRPTSWSCPWPAPRPRRPQCRGRSARRPWRAQQVAVLHAEPLDHLELAVDAHGERDLDALLGVAHHLEGVFPDEAGDRGRSGSRQPGPVTPGPADQVCPGGRTGLRRAKHKRLRDCATVQLDTRAAAL